MRVSPSAATDVLQRSWDDFAVGGPKDSLGRFKAELEQRYELTESARLGPRAEDSKEARILNRVVRWTEQGLEYEAGPRQGERLVEQLGLSGANSTTTPGVKPTYEQMNAEVPLEPEKHKAFRGPQEFADGLLNPPPDWF